MVYAGFFRRYAASFIDAIILAIPSLLMGGLVKHMFAGVGIGVIMGILYKPVFESSVMQATPGKALLGIIVQSESGQQISFKQALIRFFCAYISLAIAGIGYLMQPFTAKRQTLHDMLSESVVIKKEMPDLNYFVVWRDHVKTIFAKL